MFNVIPYVRNTLIIKHARGKLYFSQVLGTHHVIIVTFGNVMKQVNDPF